MIAIGTITFVCLVFAVMAFFRLTAIALTEDAVMMHTAYKDVHYPYRELEFVGVLEPDEWSPGLYRTFGYGYPFPLYGRFTSARLGDVTIYSVRRMRQLTLFRFQGRKILIGLKPDEIAHMRAVTHTSFTAGSDAVPFGTLPSATAVTAH